MAKHQCGTANEDFGPLPTIDRSGRHLTDQMLRAAKFRIHSRPKSGPNLWERHGKVYPEVEAFEIANRETT